MKEVLSGMQAALANALAEPLRLLSSSLAVALGLAVAVTSILLSATAQRQVASDFDALRATEVRVRALQPDDIPGDYEKRLAQLSGIDESERVGIYGSVAVASSPPHRRDVGTVLSGALYGVDVGGPKAVEARIIGAPLDHAVAQLEPAQVLVGSRLAAQLGLGEFDGVRAVWLENRPYVIRGFLEDGGRYGQMVDGVILLNDEATRVAGPPSEVDLILETQPGAASAVAKQAPVALRPEAPGSLNAVAPPDPGEFRFQIESQVRVALLSVAAVALTVGGLVIAHSMAMSVVARRSEIGLRRALGATGRGIFFQFASEAVIIGLAGGLLGASLGVIGGVSVSVMMDWNPVIDPIIPVVGVVVGVALGGLSGLAAALRAAHLSPIDALRTGG